MKTNSKTTAFVLLMAVVALILPVRANSSQAQTRAITGNATTGKALYFEHTCHGCHGYNGETGRPLVGITSGNLASESSFIRYLRLRADENPILPSTRMPNYPENSLSDQQAKDIYAYIRTFKSNTPDLKDIPTLNSILKAASRPYKP